MASSEALKDARIITQSLRKAKRAMEYGVLQADTAVNLLTRDGEVINQTIDNQGNVLKNSLESSKRRLHIVKNMHLVEWWSLRLSLLFFSIVVSFVIARRLRILQLSRFILQHGIGVDITPIYNFPQKKQQVEVGSSEIPETKYHDLPYIVEPQAVDNQQTLVCTDSLDLNDECSSENLNLEGEIFVSEQLDVGVDGTITSISTNTDNLEVRELTELQQND